MTMLIDASGLSCPQPVLLVHQAIKQGVKELDVLVDNEASRENVTRAAEKNGYLVRAVPYVAHNGAAKESIVKLELRA